MMFYTSDKLTNIFECVMFVSQFHVHCKIGTLHIALHLIQFQTQTHTRGLRKPLESFRVSLILHCQ